MLREIELSWGEEKANFLMWCEGERHFCGVVTRNLGPMMACQDRQSTVNLFLVLINNLDQLCMGLAMKEWPLEQVSAGLKCEGNILSTPADPGCRWFHLY